MEVLLSPISEAYMEWLEVFIDDWFFVFALVFLAFEFLRYAIYRKLNWTLIGDAVTNYITLAFFIGLTFLLLGTFYLGTYYFAFQLAVFDIEINWVTVLICVVLADLTYYWEHRFMHRVNFAWATHTVHHSSPFFNISVAYRFGPMDSLWPLFFHLPLVVLGFNPIVVLFAEMVVQVYQTILHTEVIRKLPRPFEAIVNTPSHHRVHHGSNRKYLDKNYAGIFIIWDRMFGTFAEEKEEVVYGLVTPINSINPLVAFFHGFYRLGKDVWEMSGFKNKLGVVFGPPGWKPGAAKSKSVPAE
ncbi:sterol desaturase family protein [Sneathiella marina]|uniref:Sterol desaturase family protein n=1 Tax=Sneathiella marina TaxID=2950108 RepID=A0ABY4W4R3_9PROT|nr:sterol desaturase family protein [Sneathiella marina]USG61103.1 sterol desaturase family protein [Sneathiella marina]